MSGERRAALALHGLAPQDRDLILADLEPGQQALLRRHLSELRELGFDPRSHAILPVEQAPTPGPVVQAPLSARQTVAGATPETMLTLLAHEPAALVGQLLAVAQWPWSQHYLSALPPVRRLAVEAVMAGADAAPARAHALVNAAAEALSRHAPQAAPRARALSRLFVGIKSWKR